MLKRWWPALGLLLALAVIAVPVSAGILTSGSYTYMFKGREQNLPVDILTVQGATLVPTELLSLVQVVPEAEADSVTLKRGPVTVQMRLGSETAVIGDTVKLLQSGPLLVGGRLFIPAEVLPELGLTLGVDGKFVLLGDYLPEGGPVPDPAGNPLYDDILKNRTAHATVRDGTSYGSYTITLLNAELLKDPRLSLNWGTRVKLLSMLQTRTLLLVQLRNTSPLGTTIALDPNKLLLVDDVGRQYDYLKTEVAVDGLVTTAVAPGATRVSVLAYGKADGALKLYYAGMPDPLGRLPVK